MSFIQRLARRSVGPDRRMSMTTKRIIPITPRADTLMGPKYHNR